jgi:glycosyltransferase involved in cell wall biosynthesis
MGSQKKSEDLNIAIFTRILSKTMGGMERQILSIANDLIEGGHNVIIISLDQVIPDLFFDANSKIQFVPISEGNASLNADIVERLKRQKKVFKLLKDKQIDVAITFMTGAYWYSAIPIRLRGIGLILAERNSPTIYDHIRVGRMRHLIFASMVLASKITVQFESYRDRYPFYLRRRIVEIPNKIPQYVTNARPSDTRFHFVYAGRFSHQKQILELAHAFISFHKQNPETILEIYGDGELKKDLEQIISSNGAEIYITLNPAVVQIDLALMRADTLLAPSLWEGFPNSVAEALSYGVPVGGFSDCDGVCDLVNHGENGWLIKRTDREGSILKLLQTIYEDRSTLPIKSINAKKSMLKYQGEEANIRWETLLRKLT